MKDRWPVFFLYDFILCGFSSSSGNPSALGCKVPMIIAVATSLSITIFELIPLRITPKIVINDNLAVPVISGFVMLYYPKWFLESENPAIRD